MKKIIIAFCCLIFLNGCVYRSYAGGSNEIQDSADIRDMFEMIMDKNDHSDNLLVPAELIQLFLVYVDDKTYVVDINYNVYKYQKDGKSYYDSFHCSNMEDRFTCGSVRVGYDDPLVVEISLDTAITDLSKYEVKYIVSILSKRYYIDLSKEVSLDYSYKKFENKTLDIDSLGNTLLLKDGKLISRGVEEISSLLMSVKITLTIANEKEIILLYIDTD